MTSNRTGRPFLAHRRAFNSVSMRSNVLDFEGDNVATAGLMFATFAAGSGLGSYLMGACFDLAGSYRPMLGAFVLALIAACLMIARVGPYRCRAEGAPAAA